MLPIFVPMNKNVQTSGHFHFKKGRKKRESIGKLILQRSAAEAEAPREAVAAALLLLLALILLLALLRIA